MIRAVAAALGIDMKPRVEPHDNSAMMRRLNEIRDDFIPDEEPRVIDFEDASSARPDFAPSKDVTKDEQNHTTATSG